MEIVEGVIRTMFNDWVKADCAGHVVLENHAVKYFVG